MGFSILDIRMRIIFGLLFFLNKFLCKFFRDFYMFFRKVIIIIVTQILPLEDDSKSLTLLLVIGGSIYIQLSRKPFLSQKINDCEIQSLIMIFTTFYLGFVNFSGENKDFDKIFAILFYIYNILFFVYWIFQFWIKDFLIKKKWVSFFEIRSYFFCFLL